MIEDEFARELLQKTLDIVERLLIRTKQLEVRVKQLESDYKIETIHSINKIVDSKITEISKKVNKQIEYKLAQRGNK